MATYRSASTVSFDTATATLTVPVPAGVQAGDLLVVALVTNLRPTYSFVTIPAGWTQVERSNGSTYASVVTFVKIAGASEPASYSWVLSNAVNGSAAMLAYSGNFGASPVEVSANVVNSTASTNIAAPSVTTLDTNRLVISVWGTASTTAVTADPATTQRVSFKNTTTVRPFAIGDVMQAVAGASGVKTATSGAATSTGQTLAIVETVAAPAAPIEALGLIPI